MFSNSIELALALLIVFTPGIQDAKQIPTAMLSEAILHIPTATNKSAVIANNTDVKNSSCIRNENRNCQNVAKDLLNNRRYLTFYFITIVLTAMGYAPVLRTILKKKRPSSVFIFSLAISDIFVAVAICPTKILELYGAMWQKELDLCRLVNCITMWGIAMAGINMVVVSIDRFLFFALPLRYESLVTPKRAVIGCCIAYLFTLPILFPLIGVGDKVVVDLKYCAFKFTLSKGYLWFASITYFFIPSGVITYCQVAIILLTKRYFRIHRDFIKCNPKNTAQKEHLELSLKREMRIQRMFLIIVIMFIVCWGPFIAGVICTLLAPPLITPIFIQIVGIMLFINSFINPFIIIFSMPNIIKGLVHFRIKKEHSTDLNSNVNSDALSRRWRFSSFSKAAKKK